jgi:hypothetical protein
LYGRAGDEEAEAFVPVFDEEDPDSVDPVNLAENLAKEDMDLYSQLVRTGMAQVEEAPLMPVSPPRPAFATGGDETTSVLASLMQHLLSKSDEDSRRRQTLSQKDAAAMLLAVPSVVVDGQVLQGPKLLAWFKELVSTYLEASYWTSSYSFNATKGLFHDAPELLATWRQATQANPQVVQLKDEGRWLDAWKIVATCIVTAHVGDRFLALRKKLKAPQHLAQTT